MKAMVKVLNPPPDGILGNSRVSFVGMWRDIISRHPMWRAEPNLVEIWIGITGAFAGSPSGPWQFDERILALLARGWRSVDRSLDELPFGTLHYLMICINAIDTALSTNPTPGTTETADAEVASSQSAVAQA